MEKASLLHLGDVFEIGHTFQETQILPDILTYRENILLPFSLLSVIYGDGAG